MVRFEDTVRRADALRETEALGFTVLSDAFSETVVDAESEVDVTTQRLERIRALRGVRDVELIRWSDVLDDEKEWPPGSVCFARSRRQDRVVLTFDEGTDWEYVVQTLDAHGLTLRKTDRSQQTVTVESADPDRAVTTAEASPLVAYAALVHMGGSDLASGAVVVADLPSR